MVVSGHEAVDVARPKEGAHRSGELDEKDHAVGLVHEERASSDASSGHVEHSVIEKAPWRTRHRALNKASKSVRARP
jgi:hypothetical protein